jgi:hypothetical protein
MDEEYKKQLDEANNIIEGQKETIKVLSDTSNIKQPEVLGSIRYGELYGILNPITDKLYMSDEVFSTTSVEEAKVFSLKTKVFAQKWVAEDHDCDNFSFGLLGYWSDGLKSFPLGVAFSEKHAFNIFVDNDKQVWIVEPQTNEWMTIEQAKKKSSPDKLSYWPMRLILL